MAALETESGRDHTRSEGARFTLRDHIHPHVEAWCSTRSLAEVRSAWDEHGVCWRPYQSFLELVRDDPRCSTKNPMFSTVEQPGIGSYLAPGSPLTFTQLGRKAPAPAPVLGQHTDEVLSTLLGLSDAELGRLHDDGVIAGPSD